MDSSRLYQDQASGKKDYRPGLEARLESLRGGHADRSLEARPAWAQPPSSGQHVHDLTDGTSAFGFLPVRANIDTTTAARMRLVFGIFAALAEFRA